MPTWVATIHYILEILYYVSGIVIAAAALYGLKQLKIGLDQLTISKEVARANAKRESIRYASEQCRYFAERVVPALTAFVTEYRRLNLTFVPAVVAGQPPALVVRNGEIVVQGYDARLLDAQWQQIEGTIVACLNTYEAFAIPFASGVADEDIGYRETARPFCQGAQDLLAGILQLRRTNAGRYESVVRLHEMWSRRLTAEIVAPIVGQLGELIRNAGHERIRPVGPHF